MNLWNSAIGMMEVELTSADMAMSLEVIRSENIPIFRFHTISDLTSRFCIQRKNYTTLRGICEKRGETLKLLQKTGVYWTMVHILRRPVLYIGLAILSLSAVFIPQRVLFVEVTGNVRLPSNLILEAAEECGVSFGASRRQVRSEKVKNAILSRVPQLQWAGVNTRGCVAIISVRERTLTEETEGEYRVSSIIADRDGRILSCTATRGTLTCAEGMAVKAGELLISGYTDCGLSIQATQAQGEVYAETIREMTAVTPKNWMCHLDIKDWKYRISILIGKKRINLWKDSGIWDTTCGRMYKEYYLTLPGGFQLPVAICVDTYTLSDSIPYILTPKEAGMEEFAEKYLSRQMIAGKITSSDVSVSESDYYLLRGTYVCTEMIGRVQFEKMGEYNG